MKSINHFGGIFIFPFCIHFQLICHCSPQVASQGILRILWKLSRNVVDTRWQLFRRATTSPRRVGRSGLAPPSTTPTRPRLSRARIGVVPPARPVPTWGNQATSPLLLTVRTIYLQSKHALSNFVLSSSHHANIHSLYTKCLLFLNPTYWIQSI